MRRFVSHTFVCVIMTYAMLAVVSCDVVLNEKICSSTPIPENASCKADSCLVNAVEGGYEEQVLRLANERLTMQSRVAHIIAASLLVILMLSVLTIWLMLRNHKQKIRMIRRMETMRNNFFRNITHEFRTPLTIMLGQGNAIAGDASQSDSVRGKAATIVRQGDILMTLINQLLDISRINSEVGNPEWRNGDIATFLAMTVDNCRCYAESKNVLLYLKTCGNFDMDFVPDYMSKMMNNLITNAIKFTDSDGSVNVELNRMGNNAVITVSDTGTGISAECLDNIFEPFYQAGSGKQSVGTGVGLALVKQIVVNIGGSIKVRSRQGEGSVFTVTMPVKHGDGNWPRTESVVAETPVCADRHDERESDTPDVSDNVTVENGENVRSEGGAQPVKALIVDDNTDMAHYIGSCLGDDYELYYAADGQMAMKKADEIMPDIVITDYMMPETDGLQLCRSIRGNEYIGHIPVIIVSAKVSDTDRIRALEAGADAYITKPFKCEELRVCVQKQLEKRLAMRHKFSEDTVANGDVGRNVTMTDADRRFLNRTVDIIYKLMGSRQVDVDKLCEMHGMSYRKFHRKLTAVTGESPAAFMMRIRMRKAKQLLEGNAAMSMEEITRRCGFANYSSFYHAFKKMYGTSPTQYRKTGEL